MNLAKALALLAFLIMLGAITYGFVAGDFSREGGVLLSLAWGRVTMIDLYLMFFIFCGWIIFRERSVLPSLIWIILMMGLGALTASFYVLLALYQSKGDLQKFWFGRRAGSA